VELATYPPADNHYTNNPFKRLKTYLLPFINYLIAFIVHVSMNVSMLCLLDYCVSGHNILVYVCLYRQFITYLLINTRNPESVALVVARVPIDYDILLPDEVVIRRPGPVESVDVDDRSAVGAVRLIADVAEDIETHEIPGRRVQFGPQLVVVV